MSSDDSCSTLLDTAEWNVRADDMIYLFVRSDIDLHYRISVCRGPDAGISLMLRRMHRVEMYSYRRGAKR